MSKTRNLEIAWLPQETAHRQEEASPAGNWESNSWRAGEEAMPHEVPLGPSQGPGAFFSPSVDWNHGFWNRGDLRKHLTDKESESHMVN